MTQAQSSRKTAQVHIGGRCELRCAVCDCRDYREERDLDRRLAGGGKRLTLRGAARNNPMFDEALERAHRAGFAEIHCRSSGVGFDDAAWLTRFASSGVTDVSVPLFSTDARVHDRIAGETGALAKALYGLRALHGAGLGVEIEVPLLPARLQDLVGVVDLAHRAVPALRRVRFYMPLGKVPDVIAAPRWNEGGGARLAAALRHCEKLGLPVALQSNDGVPLCALRDEPDLQRLYRFDPRGRAQLPGASKGGACSKCVARKHCPGVVESYAAAHGDAGVTPYDRRPKQMFEQRTTPSRVWTDEQRRSARASDLLVLRPTVNCNQDCPFCSANESSSNIWTDPALMYRQIARAARRGIPRVSFGGGEPTLSKHLVSFVRVASRAGMREVEIVSNGALLDRKERVDELVAAGLTDAFISLHAHSEELSRRMTHKLGDFDRTIKAIHHLLDGGVRVVLNHVIGERNYRYLPRYMEFIHGQFGGRVGLSLAFMTPQFKALTNIELVPRISDAMPFLKRAMYRALELNQPFHIGARQGIPPCLLGEFRGWSDILSTANMGISEDQHQKQKAPQCASCQYTQLCTGLWKPYVARYGLDELTPVDGVPFTFEDSLLLRSERVKPSSFDGFPDRLSTKELEWQVPAAGVAPEDPTADFRFDRSRPLRVVLIGTGQRGRRIVRDAQTVTSVVFDAVASPHAPDGDLTDFGFVPAYRDVDDALDTTRPDAVIVASATPAHDANVRAAVERGVPVLVEKPAARTLQEGEALVALIRERGTLVSMAHNVLYAAGLGDLWRAVPSPTRVVLVARVSPTAPSALRTWHAEGMFQSLYHAVALVTRAVGGGEGAAVSAQHQGASRPELLKLVARFGESVAEFVLDYRGAGDELSITLDDAAGRSAQWRRSGPQVTLAVDGAPPRPVERRGNEIAEMVTDFARAAATGGPAPVPIETGLDVMRTTNNLIAALERAGAPFSDAAGPKHVASKQLVVEHHRPSRRAPTT